MVPQGGFPGSGYNSEMQPDYVSWRLQAISAIDELGQRAKPILKDLDNDKYGSYFYSDSASRVLGALKGALGIAQRQLQEMSSTSPAKSKQPVTTNLQRVFLVHGHDQVMLHQTARFLEKLDLEPIILFEQPAKGQTIIEKFEQFSDVNFAMILLTPDDLGKAAGEEGELRPRARQNVILELGYFLAKLGRPNVAALYHESVELPSDYRGVEYIRIDAEGAWKMKLARELKAAGLPVDMNKAI